MGILLNLDAMRRQEGYRESRSLSNPTYAIDDYSKGHDKSVDGATKVFNSDSEPILTPDFPSDWIMSYQYGEGLPLIFLERASKVDEDKARAKLKNNGQSVPDNAIFTRKVLPSEYKTKLTSTSKVFDARGFQDRAVDPGYEKEDMDTLLAMSVVSSSVIRNVVAQFGI